MFSFLRSLPVFGCIPFSAFKCSLTSDLGTPFAPAPPRRFILTVDIQRDAGLQRMTLGHGTIPDNALVLGTIVRSPGQYLQRRVRVVVLRAALQRIRLQRHTAALTEPAAKRQRQRHREREREIEGEERERFSVEKSMCRVGIINEGAQLSDLLAAGCALTGRTDHTTSAAGTAATATTVEPRNTGWAKKAKLK